MQPATFPAPFTVPSNIRGTEPELFDPDGVDEVAYQRRLDAADRAREWAADARE